MTRRVLLALPLLLAAPALGRDGKPEDVVARAVEAAGGADVLNRFPAGRVTAKGTVFSGNTETPVAVEQVFHVPGRMRTVAVATPKGKKVEVVQVVNGAKFRQTINGAAVPITEAVAKDLHLAVLLLEVGQLTPLLTDPKFVLKPDKAEKRPELAGLQVQVKGYPELRLGFDRKTGHLVRVARKAPDPETTKEAEFETVLSDYKAFGGLTRPTRATLYRDGQKSLELVTEAFTPLEKVAAEEFAAD